MAASVQTLQQPFLSLAVAVSSTHPRRRLSAIFLLSLSLAVDFLSPVQGSSVDPQIPSFASKFKVEAERKIILEVREGQNNEMACENLSGKRTEPSPTRTCHSADPSFRKGIVDRFFPARSFCIGFSNTGNGTSFRKGCNYRAAAAYFSFSSKRRVS
ncbi:uncharacterized protein [Malus domestica]|uniref:uncharacterized protein n=1 Tax=Malus domestica TaxID=3750 RepID=UPI003974FABD